MTTTAVFEFDDGEAVRVTLAPIPYREYRDFRVAWFGDLTWDTFVKLAAQFTTLAMPERTNGEPFEDLDVTITKGVINAWINGIGAVPVPLPVESSDGGRPREQSIETPAAESSPRPSSRKRSGSTRS